MLISIFNKCGLKLVPKNELINNYKIFNKSTGTFKELFNKFLKVNPDTNINKLNDDEYKVLKDFSDLHRYFIFKLDNNKIIPDNVFSDTQKCIEKTMKTVHVNDRYPNIKLPMPVSFDTNLINQYITQHRSLIGHFENIGVKSTDNFILMGRKKILNPF